MNYQFRQNKVLNLMDNNSVFVIFNKRPFEEAKSYDCCRNFYYLTGINEFDDILLFVRSYKSFVKLYIHTIDLEEERWTGKMIGCSRMLQR